MLFLVLAVTVPAPAQVYSYTDSKGRLVLTDVPGRGRKMVSGSRSTATDTAETASAPLAARDREIDRLVVKYAAAYDLEERLLRAVIKAESDFDHKAVSHKGAMGLMQLMPETGKEYGVRDFFDPEENIRAGARHLRKLLDRYFGDYELALAAYNAGETAVEKYNGIPPYPETREYVRKIMRMVRGDNYQPGKRDTGRTIYRYVDEQGRICITNVYPTSARKVEVVRP